MIVSNRASFAKLGDDTWGVKVYGDISAPAGNLSPGTEVEVAKRDHTIQIVTLGARVMTGNGRDAWFRIARPPERRRHSATRERPRVAGPGPATDKQRALIEKLLDEGRIDPDVMTEARATLADPELTKKLASGLISWLLEQSKHTRETEDTR